MRGEVGKRKKGKKANKNQTVNVGKENEKVKMANKNQVVNVKVTLKIKNGAKKTGRVNGVKGLRDVDGRKRRRGKEKRKKIEVEVA